VPVEICLLRKVSSVPGVVRLLDFYERPDSFILILERPRGCKDLFDFITERGKLEERTARRFLTHVVKVILQSHERGVIHRDIKDENILVSTYLYRIRTYVTLMCDGYLQAISFRSMLPVRDTRKFN